ncbi:hypothetical protein DNTS_017649 [Danionella cerebrum]|uniref:Uncharacterized protein n=1 Tax=Danionella cerebrum TaxID=2873325 RepID=A0A553MXE7_9TELE|nr:hypothetical protein DNTS_017649 [Danionella translucida]
MGSLENDINQDFQDAIDVIQRHSQLQPFDSGSLSESKHYETLDRPPSFLRHSISYYQLAPHFEAPGLNYEWDETSVSVTILS